MAVAAVALSVMYQEPATADDRTESLTGPVEVLSGDTLRVGGTRVRLVGVRAPAKGVGCSLRGAPFDCARIAMTALMDLVAGATVACDDVRKAEDGAVVARCRANGYDLSEGMTYTGWARAWPRTGNRYRGFEDEARARRHGLWRDGVEPPAGWR